MFCTIVSLAATLPSAAQAAEALRLCRHLDMSARHVARLTAGIGAELVRQRDQQVEQHRRRQLPPEVKAPPALAVVEVDGGRLRTRQTGCGPGVHQRQFQEDKIACLISMESVRHDQDPQPQPPASLLEPRRVQRLVQKIQALAAGGDDCDAAQDQDGGRDPDGQQRPGLVEPWVGAPKPQVRTCVATMACSREFAPMVAAEAQRRGFYEAPRGAFVADGLAYNWKIQQGYFRHCEPIVDFLHVLGYVYLAAQALETPGEAKWSRYVRWLQACWQSRVAEVLEELTQASAALGPIGADEEVAENDPREVVRQALVYLKNNEQRMDYARYRREGLPVTSSLVESLVGEFNARVKGPQKHWNRPEGAEWILQVRRAVLSDDNCLARYFAQRPGCPYRRRAA